MEQHDTIDQGERDNADPVRRYFESVWNRGELDAIDSFIDDEFSNFGQRDGNVRARTRQIMAAWRTAFPDLRFTIEDEIVRGEAVVHRVTLSGTHTGIFNHPTIGTLPPTGPSFAVDQMHLHHVRDGRIVAHWATRNDLAMLRQLGAIAAPEASHHISAQPGRRA